MTNNIFDKASALAEKAKAKRQQLVSDEKTEKQRQWQDCKDKEPEIALLLTQFHDGGFGKPEALKIESKVTKEIILRNGKFDPAKDLSVPKYSQQQWGRK
jgi:hypothetical protein